jgi:phosphate uptake regulator
MARRYILIYVNIYLHVVRIRGVSWLSSNIKEDVRRVQLTGKSTYIVSLPKKWVDEVGIEKGDSLTVIPQKDKTLLLVPKSMKRPDKPQEIVINVAPTEKIGPIIRKVVSHYLVGYNTIRLLSRGDRITSQQRRSIKDFVRRKLVGTEIISDSRDTVTLQVLLSYPELSIQDALRRMYIISTSMHKDAIIALKEMNRDLAQEVVSIDDEVDRFSFYIIRQLKSAVQDDKILKELGLNNPRDCLGFRLITKSVERIADHAVSIARNILSIETPVDKEVIETFDQVSTYATTLFDDAVLSLYKQEYALADDVVERKAQLDQYEVELLNLVSRNVSDEEAKASLRLVVESIRRTVEYASDIAEIVLNLTITKKETNPVPDIE